MSPIQDLRTHPARFIKPTQFAAYLGESPRTVYAWIEKGALHVVRYPTGSVRIPIEVAIEWVYGRSSN